MSDRTNYYFKQAVTESELNDGFTDAENADHHLMMDQGLSGIFSGGAAAQHSPLADLTIDIAGPMIAYDSNGQRIYIPGPTLNVNCAQDSSAVSTAVAGAGNEKWVSVTAKFTRVLSDPRIDGNSNTVYFLETESYQIVVTQGGEAALGTATRPALDPNGLLVCDVHRTFGQTQILNADIDATSATGRRQDTYVFAGSPVAIRAGVPKDAVQAMLTALNNHINNLVGHPASAISYAGGSAWADGSTNPATDVESQLDKILTDLGGGTTGTAKISGAAVAGTRFSVAAAKLSTQLSNIVGAVDGIQTNGADTLKQVANVAALRAIVAASRPANACVLVLGVGLFAFDAARLGADDGRYVIKPTDIASVVSPGRWVSVSFASIKAGLVKAALNWAIPNTGLGPLHRSTYSDFDKIWYVCEDGGSDVVKYSLDFGQTWAALTITGGAALACFQLGVDGAGNLVIVNGSSTRIYTYTKAGGTWNNALTPLAGTPQSPHVFFESVSGLWVIYYYDAIGLKYQVFTAPDRVTWTSDTASLPASFVSPTATSPHLGVGNGKAVVAGPYPANAVKLAWRSLGGAGWTEVTLASALAITGLSDPVYNAADGTWMIAVYGTAAGKNETEFWRSVDDGVTWTLAATIANSSMQVKTLACSGVMWVGMTVDGFIVYSTDSGSTWFNAGIQAGSAAPTQNYLSGGGGGFLYTESNGTGNVMRASHRYEPANLTALS